METFSLRCEQCDRLVGPDIVECPERPGGACPYRFYQRKLFPIHWVGLAIFLLSILLCGGQFAALLALDMEVDQFPDYLPCASFSLMAAGLALAGLYFITDYRRFDRQIQLYNPESGILWQRTSRRDKVVEELAIAGYETAVIEGERLTSLDYPASVAALQADQKKSNSAIYIFKAALASLVGREVLEFNQANILYAQKGEPLQPAPNDATFFNFPKGGVQFYSPASPSRATVGTARCTIQPGPQFEHAAVAGTVEQRLVDAMKKQARRRPVYVRQLIVDVFESPKQDPAQWLVELVQQDAAALNLAQQSPGRFKSKFELDPFRAEELGRQNLIVETWLDRLEHEQPALSQRLFEEIGRGLAQSDSS